MSITNTEIAFTIIVAVYKVNYSDLRRCLDSLTHQTNKHFEALLIDDGSPDDCGKICDEYAQKYANFRVIHQANGGLSVVRNKGIVEAKGSWVCFLDADDWVETNMIDKIIHFNSEVPSNTDLLIWEEFYNIGDTQKNNCFLGYEPQDIVKFDQYNKDDLIKLILPENYNQNNIFAGIGTCNARAYKKDFLIKNKLFNVPGLNRMQDNEFNLWVFDKAKLIFYKCIRLYHYNYNTQSATKKYNPQIVQTMLQLYKCMSKFIEEKRNTKEYWQRLYLRFILLFLNIIELDYANPSNPNSLKKRIQKAEQDFAQPEFKKVINDCNVKTQNSKIRLTTFLLRKKCYRSLIYFSLLISETRSLRLKLR